MRVFRYWGIQVFGLGQMVLPAVVMLIVMLSAATPGAAQKRPDIVVADFEGVDYGNWKTTGEAFGPGPAQGTLSNQMPVSGYVGHGLVNSFFRGDATTGALTSPEFKLERRYLNYLVGGGRHPGETGLRLLVDGKEALAATGIDSEHLEWATWDLRRFQGKLGHIEIFDRATGGWGHINVDEITLSDTRRAEEEHPEPLYGETYRPQFHFTAEKNWLNDPNGLVFYKGEYHLFFQHNPSGINWGNMTWGHAVSRDLLHWKQLPHALQPDHLGTMFSGSAVVDWHNTSGFGSGTNPPLVAIYTAAGDTSPESKGQPFTQCIAYSTDRGRNWTKYANNPVLKHIVGGNRDPKVVWYEPTKRWIMALFLDKEDYGLFSSPDLKEWTQIQTLNMPGSSECPDFFEIPVYGSKSERRWVFTGANGHYIVGTFNGAHFTPESSPLTVDYGANYYAVQTYSDIPNAARRIQVAWMTGGSYPRMPFNQQMSFPCELTLRPSPNGLRLFRWPVSEIQSIAGPPHKWDNISISPGENPLSDLHGDLWDIEAEFEPAGAAAFGFTVRGEKIRYSVRESNVSSLARIGPLPGISGRIKLRLLVDRTTIELFGNNGVISMTSCFVPPKSDHSLGIFSEGGAVRVVSLKVTPLNSAVGNRQH